MNDISLAELAALAAVATPSSPVTTDEAPAHPAPAPNSQVDDSITLASPIAVPLSAPVAPAGDAVVSDSALDAISVTDASTPARTATASGVLAALRALAQTPSQPSSATPTAAPTIADDATASTITDPRLIAAAQAVASAALPARAGDADRPPVETLRVLLQATDAAASTPALQAAAVPDVQQISAAARPTASLTVPMQSPQWSDDVGQQIRWMVNHQIQSAELRINPPQLGSIEIRINVQHDRMDVLLSAPHAQVRDALVDSVPRLRDMMSGAGFSTVNVDVSQQSAHGRPEGEARFAATAPSDDESDDAVQTTVQSLSSNLGLIDLYA